MKTPPFPKQYLTRCERLKKGRQGGAQQGAGARGEQYLYGLPEAVKWKSGIAVVRLSDVPRESEVSPALPIQGVQPMICSQDVINKAAVFCGKISYKNLVITVGEQTTIHLAKESSWPSDVLEFLDNNHDLFLGWENRAKGRAPSPALYDNAVYGLRNVLRRHSLHGYHCTRLTDNEIASIQRDGMQLPDAEVLKNRINNLCREGILKASNARQLIEKNQAGDDCRARMIWFCFFEPQEDGQHGIERFFRFWGGEALYNSHEDDASMAAVLRRIGTPCLVEADVPISLLEEHSYLDTKLVRRYLINRGFKTLECLLHEDKAKSPLPAQTIKRIIRHPSKEFSLLTGCDTWTPTL